MSHEVETMMYSKANGVPWHGLGKEIEEKDRYDIEACIPHSGLGWDVELMPLHINERDDEGEIVRCTSVKEYAQAVRRTDNQKILGVVGPRYMPLQNTDAFKWFQPLLDAKLCKLDTAGSLWDGSKVWVLAEINGNAKPMEIVKNDLIQRFLLLSNSHDSTTSVRIGMVPIRVVCRNTLAMAHNAASSKLLRLRHSKGLADNMDKVRDIISLANKEFEATAEQYKFLASRRIVNPSDLRKFVKIVAKVDLETPDSEISTRTKNTMDKITSLVSVGMGQDLPGVKGTWWAAYNAASEFLTWQRGNTPANRLDALWFGQGFNDNLSIMKTALELATAA